MPSPSYITREQLSTLLLDSASNPSIAIIDVRDDDHVGGHILGSTHVPSSSLEYRMPELVRTLRDKQMVVFHCALSQQRGPTAARRYIQHREWELAQEHADSAGKYSTGYTGGSMSEAVGQRVYILDGGFVKWQEIYGPNPRLTAAYALDLWAYGY